MKTLFTLFIICSLISSTASAQNSGVMKPTVDPVILPSQLSGSSNYSLSLSEQDFKNKKYVFYTDSSATVAHISINGTGIRLTGWPNGEHIMAYTCKGYTVTLSANKNTGTSNSSGHPNFTLVIYMNGAAPIVTQVVGQSN